MSACVMSPNFINDITMVTRVWTFSLLTQYVCFRGEFKPKKIKTENDKKAKKRKQENEVRKGLWVSGNA